MKKFLSVIALLLVAAMMMATPMYVSAEETEVNPLGYQSSNVGHTYVANYLTTPPTPDGNISAAEYGLASGASASISTPTYLTSVPFGATGGGNWTNTAYPDAYHSNYLYKTLSKAAVEDPANEDILNARAARNDFYFAHDDENIYIAMYVDAPAWDAANGGFIWRELAEFRIGINMDDATQFVQFGYNGPYLDWTASDGIQAQDLLFQFGTARISEGKAYAHGDNGSKGIPLSSFTNYFMLKETLYDGTVPSAKWYNAPNAGGGIKTWVEISMSKSKLVEVFNLYGGTNYATAPNAFFIAKAERCCSVNSANSWDYTMSSAWLGNGLETPLANGSQLFPDLVVLDDGDASNGAETSAADVVVPVTRTATDVPVMSLPTANRPLVGQSNVTVDGTISEDENYFVTASAGVSAYPNTRATKLPNYIEGSGGINFSTTTASVWKVGPGLTADDGKALMDTSKYRMAYSSDDENYYVVAQIITGVTDKYVTARYQYDFHFDLGYAIYPTLSVNHNGYQSNAMKADDKIYSLAELGSDNGTMKSEGSTILSDLAITKRVRSDDTPYVVGDFDDYDTFMGPEHCASSSGAWAKQTHMDTYEFAISKAKVAAYLGVTEDKLPDTIGLAISAESVTIRVNDDGVGYDTTDCRVGALYNIDVDATQHNFYAVNGATFINCADCVNLVAELDSKYLLVENTTFGDVYAKSCVTCGAYFAGETKDLDLTFHTYHIYDKDVVDVDLYIAGDPACVTPATYYKSCVCGASAGNETDADHPGYMDTFLSGSANGHTFGTDWAYDETQHWHECTLGDNCDDPDGLLGKNDVDGGSGLVTHTYDQEVDDAKYLKTAATCKDEAVYYKSCICGAFSTTADTFETDIDLTNHLFGETPVFQSNYHFYQCTNCLASDAPVECTFANGNKCTVCGGTKVETAPVTPPTQTEPEDTTPPVTEPEDTTPPATEPEDTTPPATEPEDTTPPPTEPEDTTPPATEPEETTPVESESEAETEPADDNCNNTISVMGLALVAALGACGVVATKKKDEE